MNRKDLPKFNWKSLQNQAGDVLGNDFWQDIMGIVPNMGPRVDAYETDKEVVVVAEIPGLCSPEDVRVSIRGSHLIIQGNVELLYNVEESKLYLSERFHGQFKREIPIPHTVSPQTLKAHYYNGLLEIEIAKVHEPEAIVPVDFKDDNTFTF